jgi:penicillin-binding protein 1A
MPLSVEGHTRQMAEADREPALDSDRPAQEQASGDGSSGGVEASGPPSERPGALPHAPASAALFEILQRAELGLRGWLSGSRTAADRGWRAMAAKRAVAWPALAAAWQRARAGAAATHTRRPRGDFAGERRRVGWKTGLAALVILPICFGLGYLAYCAFTIPLEGGLALDPLPSALVIQAADSSVLATRGNFRGEKLGADDMPQTLMKAVVAIEDRRFYSHAGIDLRGMGRAIVRDLRVGRARQGASTITQQLARLMFLSPDRTLHRKVQEALIAVWLEHQLSKREILVRYLNSA